MKKLVFLLFLTCSAFSQIPQLVKDINPRNRGINVYKPLGSVGATSYFTFFDFETGLELWKTDHTSNGTVKVKVISTLPIAPSKIINLNGIAIFKLETEAYGLEMWRSDGTEAGTYMIKDIRPGPLGSLHGNSNDWILFNNFIYFNGEDGVNGEELWRTDGTEAGTQMLVNLNGILTDSRPQGFVNHNGNLYFGALGKLWVSDGTAVGTTEIATIGSSLSNSPAQLISCGNKVFFRATTAAEGTELWYNDGTSTKEVIIKSGTGSSLGFLPATCLNQKLFFAADDGINGTELWNFDSPTNTLSFVKDIKSGISSGLTDPKFTVFDNAVYFVAEDDVNGSEFWKTTGTMASTVLVKDIRIGSSGSSISNFSVYNDNLFFSAHNGVNGQELWVSKGTFATTGLFSDIQLGSEGSSPSEPLQNNGDFIFTANNGIIGNELWISDGISTSLLKEIFPGTYGSIKIHEFEQKQIGEKVYFGADVTLGSSINPQSIIKEAWVSDGSESGTFQLSPYLGDNYLNPSDFAVANNKVFIQMSESVDPFKNSIFVSDGVSPFGATVLKENARITNALSGHLLFNVSGTGLWSSDGTVPGTILLDNLAYSGIVYNDKYYYLSGTRLKITDGTLANTQILASPTFGDPNVYSNYKIIISNNLVYFNIFKAGLGNQIWVSDGTAAGTTQVVQIESETADNVQFLGSSSNYLFWSSNFGNGVEIWRTNGTPQGLLFLKNINQASTNNNPTFLALFNNEIYFSIDKGGIGTEIWKSDGTSIGTVLVKDVNPGTATSAISILGQSDSFILFGASTPSTGKELWKSDGTTNGTFMIKELNPGVEDGISSSTILAKNGNDFYFPGTTSSSGKELWKTNGTTIGTYLVKDIYPGTSNGDPRALKYYNGYLYFLANDGVHGQEIWKTNGLAASAELVIDLYPGVNTSNIKKFGEFPNNILIYANNGTTGNELYKLDFCTNNLLLTSPANNISGGNSNFLANNNSGYIIASNEISNNAKTSYQAKSILLEAGFSAENGTVFLAEIGGCN